MLRIPAIIPPFDDDEYDGESGDGEEEEEEEETAQIWMVRHLCVQLDRVDEQVIRNFIQQQDCSPLINFLNSADPLRVLYVLVEKKRLAVPAILPQPVQEEKPAGEKAALPRVQAPAARPKRVMRVRPKKMTTKKTKNVVESEKKETKPVKVLKPIVPERKESKMTKGSKAAASEKKKQAEQKVVSSEDEQGKEEARKEIEKELGGATAALPEVVLKWGTADGKSLIPTTQQFAFVVPRNQPVTTEKSDFDRVFIVGHCTYTPQLRTAFSVAQMLLGNPLERSAAIDLLLAVSGSHERKLPYAQRLERFVIENIGRCYSQDGRRKSEIGGEEIRSIELLLSPNLQQFALKPLSFFDIDFLTEERDIGVIGARMMRAMEHLHVMVFLYKSQEIEWIRKAFFYLIDFFSTLLSSAIKRKTAFIEDRDAEKVMVGSVCTHLAGFVSEVEKLSERLFDKEEDRVVAEKLRFSFGIVIILEEEIDELLENVLDLDDKRRDMTRDRAPLDAANKVLQSLLASLQENCLESAVESGNFDSLRTLCLAIHSFNLELKAVIPPLLAD